MPLLANTTFTRAGSQWTYGLYADPYSGSAEPLYIISQPVRRVGSSSPGSILTPILASRMKVQVRDVTGTLIGLLEEQQPHDYRLEVQKDGDPYYQGSVVIRGGEYDPTQSIPNLTIEASDLPESLSTVDYEHPTVAGDYHRLTRSLDDATDQAIDLPLSILYQWRAKNQISSRYPTDAHQVRAKDWAPEEGDVRTVLQQQMRFGAMQLMQYKGRLYALQRSARRDQPVTLRDPTVGTRQEDLHRELPLADVVRYRDGEGDASVSPPRVRQHAAPVSVRSTVQQRPIIQNPRFNDWVDGGPVGWDAGGSIEHDSAGDSDRLRITNGLTRVRQQLNDDIPNSRGVRIAGRDASSGQKVARLKIHLDIPDGSAEEKYFDQGGNVFDTPQNLTAGGNTFDFTVVPDYQQLTGRGVIEIILWPGSDGAEYEYAGPWDPTADDGGEEYSTEQDSPSAHVYAPLSMARTGEVAEHETAVTYVSDTQARIRIRTSSTDPQYTRASDWLGPDFDETNDEGRPYLSALAHTFIDRLPYRLRRAAEHLRQAPTDLQVLDLWVRERSDTPVRDIIHVLTFQGTPFVPVFVEDYTWEPVRHIVAIELRYDSLSDSISRAEVTNW